MRLIYSFLFLLTFAIAANSQELQDNAKSATLFDGNIRSGGYGAFDLRISSVNVNEANNTAVFIGGRGGWIINSTFSIGGGGYGMVSKYTVDEFVAPESFATENYETPTFQVGYGGLFLEYTHNSNDLIHLTLNTLVGAGGASYASQKVDSDNKDNAIDFGDDSYQHETSAFFVLEPGATLELNILPFFRISTGISYRFVSGLNLSQTQNKDLKGISYTLAFKFGKF